MSKHIFGVIAKVDGSWWVAQFPDLDAEPTALFRLDNNLTAGFSEWLTADTNSPTPITTIDQLDHEGNTHWCGEFSLTPVNEAVGIHQIDAHPWGSTASEIELARTLALITANAG